MKIVKEENAKASLIDLSPHHQLGEITLDIIEKFTKSTYNVIN